jgi:hypothetical protein
VAVLELVAVVLTVTVELAAMAVAVKAGHLELKLETQLLELLTLVAVEAVVELLHRQADLD